MAQAILSSEAGANRTARPLDAVTGSAISWAAVFAGAVAAAALSLILFILGTGLGLSSISPWTHDGVSASTFGISTIIWITVTQILAAGLGGYLAGRLRTRWADIDRDEVYFRDTAHGFLAWAVATLATAALLVSTIGAIVNGGVQATSHVASGAAHAGTVAAVTGADTSKSENTNNDVGYFVDSLFRKNADAKPAAGGEEIPAAEVTRIFANASTQETLPAEDATYIVKGEKKKISENNLKSIKKHK